MRICGAVGLCALGVMCWRTLLAFQDVEAGAQRREAQVRVLGGGLRNVVWIGS